MGSALTAAVAMADFVSTDMPEAFSQQIAVVELPAYRKDKETEIASAIAKQYPGMKTNFVSGLSPEVQLKEVRSTSRAAGDVETEVNLASGLSDLLSNLEKRWKS